MYYLLLRRILRGDGIPANALTYNGAVVTYNGAVVTVNPSTY